MRVTTVNQFGVLMIYAAGRQNQITQPDCDCSQLSHTLACKIPANKVNRHSARHSGIAVYPWFLAALDFS